MKRKEPNRSRISGGKKSLGIGDLPHGYFKTESWRAHQAAKEFLAHTNRELRNAGFKLTATHARDLINGLNTLDQAAVHHLAIEQLFQHIAERRAYIELMHKYANHRGDVDKEVDRRVRANRTAIAKLGAETKLARDPKQAAKAKAKKLWLERRAGRHPSLRTNEQFAIECMRLWPELTSLAVIAGWCTKWNKEAQSSES